jgi:hypothetical protein
MIDIVHSDWVKMVSMLDLSLPKPPEGAHLWELVSLTFKSWYFPKFLKHPLSFAIPSQAFN